MDKNSFLKEYKELCSDEKSNYESILHLISGVLESERNFFINNHLLVLLARYPETISSFIEICNDNYDILSNIELVALFYSYVHIFDIDNAKKVLSELKSEFLVSKKEVIEGIAKADIKSYVNDFMCIRYDANIQSKIDYFLKDFDEVLEFIKKKYTDHRFAKVFVTILDGGRIATASPFIKEIIINTGIYSDEEFDREMFIQTLLHEYTHLYQNHYYKWGINLSVKDKNIWRFFNEAYADFKGWEFARKLEEVTQQSNMLAFHLFNSNLLSSDKILNEFEVRLVPTKKKLILYNCLVSFISYLIDKFGYEKVNNLYSQSNDYEHGNSFVQYIELYFGVNAENLLKDWEQNIILIFQVSAHNCNDVIISDLSLEEQEDSFIFHYESFYKLSVWDNIIVYSGNEIVERHEMDGQKYLEESNFKILKLSIVSDNLQIFVHYRGLSQCLEIRIL